MIDELNYYSRPKEIKGTKSKLSLRCIFHKLVLKRDGLVQSEPTSAASAENTDSPWFLGEGGDGIAGYMIYCRGPLPLPHCPGKSSPKGVWRSYLDQQRNTLPRSKLLNGPQTLSIYDPNVPLP